MQNALAEPTVQRSLIRSYPLLFCSVATLLVGVVFQQQSWARGTVWLLGLFLIWSVAVPGLIASVVPRRWAVPFALAVAAVPLVVGTGQAVTEQQPARQDIHDGGVLATDAAAAQLLDGRNPYRADNREALEPVWGQLERSDGSLIPNPLGGHFPYLPGAFLVTVPFHLVGNALGMGWDPRILYLGVALTSMLAVARLPRSPYLLAAMICTLGSVPLRLYLTWGTNDAVAACLLLLTLLSVARPRLAGALLALAISFKFLILLWVLPLAILVHRRNGWAGIRRWWTAPALLTATCAPFLLAGPGHFVEDTVLFNLGLVKPSFPTSGLGLPAVWPGVFHGPLLLVVTLLFAVAALIVPVYAVRRWPSVATVAIAGSVGLLGVLLPARTFQHPYLVLFVVPLSLTWLLLKDDSEPAEPLLGSAKSPIQLDDRCLGDPLDTRQPV